MNVRVFAILITLVGLYALRGEEAAATLKLDDLPETYCCRSPDALCCSQGGCIVTKDGCIRNPSPETIIKMM